MQSVASAPSPLPSPSSIPMAWPFLRKLRSRSSAQQSAGGFLAKTPSEFSLAPPPSYRSRTRTSSLASRTPSYDTDGPVINALAFDGGGIRGIASAVVIDTIMEDYSAATGEASKPVDLFQLMGGTSTGGLIAMVLGRLRLTTTALVDIYTTLSERLFSSKLALLRSLFTGSKYSAVLAQRLFSEIVEEHAPDGDDGALLMGGNSEDLQCCKAFVTAVNGADASGDPLVIRSYPHDISDTKSLPTSISIADAARATTAAPSFFPAKRLPDGTVALDGGLVANNPTELVISEARAQYGPGVRFGLLLSIGTGEKRPTALRVTSAASILSFTKALGDIVTGSEKVHRRVDERFGETDLGAYIRINIPEIGNIHLDDYKSIPKIVKATKEYMETAEMKETRKEIVALLTLNRKTDQKDKSTKT